jgi:hypothetical protein
VGHLDGGERRKENKLVFYVWLEVNHRVVKVSFLVDFRNQRHANYRERKTKTLTHVSLKEAQDR